jgi:hypothetical protein
MSEAYYLFLDDERDLKNVKWVELPKDYRKWYTVRDYTQFVSHIQTNGVPHFIAFDHDLALEHYVKSIDKISYSEYKERSGYDCAKWLCDYCLDNKQTFPIYVVHSMNPIGKENIISYIEQFVSHHGLKRLENLY